MPKDLLGRQVRHIGLSSKAPATIQIPGEELASLQSILKIALFLLARENWIDMAIIKMIDALPVTPDEKSLDSNVAALLKAMVVDHGLDNLRLSKLAPGGVANLDWNKLRT